MRKLSNRLKYLPAVIAITLLSACAGSSHDASSMVGKCPQPRFTDKAPKAIYNLQNPLPNTAATMAAGEELYIESSAQVPCAQCHGETGDGRGIMASMFDPPPRNFCCSETIDGVPDGQLFWIIKNGSPGTSMPAFNKLSDDQIWQLVHYLRKLSKRSS